MGTHQEPRAGMSPCPRQGACHKGESHKTNGPQHLECQAVATGQPRSGASSSAGGPPPAAADQSSMSHKTWRDFRAQDLHGSVELPGDAVAGFGDGEYGEPMVFMESEDGALAGLKYIQMGPFSDGSNTGVAFDFEGADEYDVSSAAGDVYVDIDTEQIMIRPGLTHGDPKAPGDAMSLEEFASLPTSELHWLAGEEVDSKGYRPAQMLRDFVATPQGEAFIRLYATRRRTPVVEETGTPEGKVLVQRALDQHQYSAPNAGFGGYSLPHECTCGSIYRDQDALGTHQRIAMAQFEVTPEGNPFPLHPQVAPEVLATRREASEALSMRFGDDRFRPVEGLVMQARAPRTREPVDLVAGEEYASALEKRGYAFVQDSSGDTYLTARGWRQVVRAEVSPTGVEIRDEQYGEPLNAAREGAAMADYITRVERAYAVAAARQQSRSRATA